MRNKLIAILMFLTVLFPFIVTIAVPIEESNEINSDDFPDNIVITYEENIYYPGDFLLLPNSPLAKPASPNILNTTDIYTTGPTTFYAASVSITEPECSSLRFLASVTAEQANEALEFGFLLCESDALAESNTELALENSFVSITRTVAYNSENGIDKTYASEAESVMFTGSLTGIPVEKYVSYITARPYIIYEVDEELICVYGNTHTESVYRLSKMLLSKDNLSNEELQMATEYVLAAENAADLSTAEEVCLNETIVRNVGSDPDIDFVKIVPEESAFYSLDFSSEEDATYEVLDEYGTPIAPIEIDNITGKTAYLFEKAQTYYIRVRGEPNADYSINATPCLQDAIIWDFSSGTEGFECGGGAVATEENGMLNISLDRSPARLKAYAQKRNLSLDLFDYSRLVIRLKNTTETTKLLGTVGIDLEYDGSYINYTLDSEMSANMSEFQNIVFDFTTRYGNVSSLRLSFGQAIDYLSGNVYIDSIAILPMPEVLSWEFDETAENWSWTEQIESSVVDEGALVLDTLGTAPNLAPAIISPGTSAYDFDKYNKLTVSLKNETASDNMQVYFSTLASGHNAFNENKKVVVEIEPYSGEFIEYSICLTEHELFTGSLKDIMISLPEEGTVSVDYIRLSMQEKVYNDVVWNFNDDLEGFYSNNERHTLSVDGGEMTVETQNADWGAFLTPVALNLPTSEYRYLVVGVSSASSSSDFQVYFATDTMNSYNDFSENDHTHKVIYKQVTQIEESDTFKEYVIDLTDVWEGYTTGYTGNLRQLMLALPNPGIFKIDYIKLTDGRDCRETDISVTKNKEYNLLVSKNGNYTIGTYTIEYDSNVFELVDACAFSYPKETNVSAVLGTDIVITDVSENSVTFTVSDKTAAGAINCLKFKALRTTQSTISVTTSIE